MKLLKSKIKINLMKKEKNILNHKIHSGILEKSNLDYLDYIILISRFQIIEIHIFLFF